MERCNLNVRISEVSIPGNNGTRYDSKGQVNPVADELESRSACEEIGGEGVVFQYNVAIEEPNQSLYRVDKS